MAKINQVEEDKQLAEFYLQGLMLAEVVKRILVRKAEIEISSKPSFVLQPVTEFMKRMRVSGLSKFDGRVYMSSINYFVDQAQLEKNKAIGTIVIYVPEIHAVKLLNRIGYPVKDEGDEEGIEDACGSLCNLIAGNFKSGLTQLGYQELVMSHFSVFQNEVINGLPYCNERPQVYEIGFPIQGVKKIAVDLNMGNIPKSGYFYL